MTVSDPNKPNIAIEKITINHRAEPFTPRTGNQPVMDRNAAVDRLETIVATVESEPMPVPVRELWVFGELALGLDPIDRLDVYLTKDVLLRDDDPDRVDDLEAEFGIQGIGRTVRADWAEAYPDAVRANDNGYAAPELCLAAHLLPEDEPIHLEVCNTGFEDNVTQRLTGAKTRGDYSQVLDPRGVCLWVDGQRSPTAFEKLRAGEYAFPTLAESLEMLGLDPGEAADAAEAVSEYRADQAGRSVRGEVI